MNHKFSVLESAENLRQLGEKTFHQADGRGLKDRVPCFISVLSLMRFPAPRQENIACRDYSRVTTGMTMGLRLVFLKR